MTRQGLSMYVMGVCSWRGNHRVKVRREPRVGFAARRQVSVVWMTPFKCHLPESFERGMGPEKERGHPRRKPALDKAFSGASRRACRSPPGSRTEWARHRNRRGSPLRVPVVRAAPGGRDAVFLGVPEPTAGAAGTQVPGSVREAAWSPERVGGGPMVLGTPPVPRSPCGRNPQS